MCDLDCANLIDLSLEDNSPQKTENVSHPSESLGLHFVSPPRKKRDSLDNNPFDCVQKLATNRQDDPFDIVEKEANFKARHMQQKCPFEVKLGNLLSLSDENLLESDCVGEGDRGKLKLKDFDLDSESPPVTMVEKNLPDSSSGPDTDSNANSSAEATASSKLKKTMEYRKHLLKLSLSNSTFNSPVSRRGSLEEVNTLSTPVSSILSKPSFFGENLLASESPLKFVDDDIMSEEPSSLLDAEKNFEADLEMLKIPMLSELQSPVHEQSSPTSEEKLSISANEKDKSLFKSNILDLEAIKAKLKAKREETNNNHQDINSLICDLKSLINGGDMVAKGKQIQASTLLESLSSALGSSQSGENSRHTQESLNVPPQPIKRQGTFDIDLQDNDEEVLERQPLVHEMPNCMTSSSATYDGETAEDKEELNLPEIDPPSSHSSAGETTLQPDVNDIMEQLSKLLIHNNSADTNGGQQNPTFIVVMNTTPMPQNSSISIAAPAAKHRSAMIASYMENSNNDGSPDLNKSSITTRRRSQSLSLHDKVKIVQIPTKPPTPSRLQRQHSMAVDESPTETTTPPPTDLETPEFKTPGRMVRRNSYSSGTPYTATVGLRRTGFSSDGKTTSLHHIRMTQTLDTHHEGQQQKAIVRPMSMPSNNFASFKPDLKKRHKPNTESIMKSSGPLKATIPVKKVAPMLKTSPPTPDKSASVSHNTSQQKINRIPTTPSASGRSLTVGVAAGYPNACSTPSAFTSPMKRSGANITKPRYSYMSTTPNPKPVATSSATAALKRRTITEFKVKSPLKSRLSTSGLTGASISARSTSTSSRLSTSSSAKLPTNPSTKTGINTATVRPTGRLGSRLSSVGSNLSTRNKENKHP